MGHKSFKDGKWLKQKIHLIPHLGERQSVFLKIRMLLKLRAMKFSGCLVALVSYCRLNSSASLFGHIWKIFSQWHYLYEVCSQLNPYLPTNHLCHSLVVM